MASISSAGSFAIPAAQPARRQAEPSSSVTETELTVKQEQQVQRASDEQSRGSSEQVKTTTENPTSSSVTQADDKKSAEQQKEQRQAEQQLADGEQQKIEVAQQEAQRAEFNQQAGNVRDTEPDDVRSPSSTSTQPSQAENNQPAIEAEEEVVAVQRDNLASENPAINTFNQFQNIDAAPRQGQELNQFV
jgi:hypothetical protein